MGKKSLMGGGIVAAVMFAALTATAQQSPIIDMNRIRSGQSPSGMSATGSQETVGTSIYSTDRKQTTPSSTLGTPPASPVPASEKAAERGEAARQMRDEIKSTPTPAPPGGSSAQRRQQSGSQQKHDMQPSEGLSFDAIRPVKGDAFERVSKAVEESIKVHLSIPPEVPTTVRMSNRDINRITCVDGAIKDVVYSKEKGLLINFTGRDAFLKYRVIKGGSRMQYVTGPTELYVSCNDQIYTIIAVPEAIPAQVLRLAGGMREKMKRNASAYGGMALEKKALALIKAAYTDEIPDSFSVTRVNKKYDAFRDVEASLERIVWMDGEGLQLKELKLTLPGRSKLTKVKISERDFLDVDITKNPIAIAVDRATLVKGDSVRVFICESTGTEGKKSDGR